MTQPEKKWRPVGTPQGYIWDGTPEMAEDIANRERKSDFTVMFWLGFISAFIVAGVCYAIGFIGTHLKWVP